MKKCSKCGHNKEPTEFNKAKKYSDGLRCECRDCQSKQTVIDSQRRRERMNQQKFDQIYRGLSEQAKKVYDCIPIAESWTPAQIMGELHRRSVSLGDFRVVMGCVNSMLDAGIVVEVSRGLFKREVIRPKCDQKEQVVKPQKELEMKQVTMENAQKPLAVSIIGPIERLSLLASRLRDLATDMENSAIELAEQAEKNDSETAKMRQLQALLKSLG